MKFDIWFQKNTFYEYKKYGISCKILIFSLFCIQSLSCTFSVLATGLHSCKKPLFKGIAKNKTEFLATAFIEDKNTNDADTK